MVNNTDLSHEKKYVLMSLTMMMTKIFPKKTNTCLLFIVCKLSKLLVHVWEINGIIPIALGLISQYLGGLQYVEY